MTEIFDSFKKSLGRLVEILGKEETIEHRDSAIQRFEFTAELAWKTFQKFLRQQKIVCRSPRECLEEAFRFGLVEDDPHWIQMFEDRNLTVHTYDEETAQNVYKHLPQYIDILRFLEKRLDEELKK